MDGTVDYVPWKHDGAASCSEDLDQCDDMDLTNEWIKVHDMSDDHEDNGYV